MRSRTFHGVLVAFALVSLSSMSFAQEKYPSRPIEVIVPWGAGGGSDQTARAMARFLEAQLKVSFPVVNVPGASGAVGTRKLLNNPADGYSIGVSGDGMLMGGKGVGPQFKLDHFLPLAVLVRQPGALLVAANGPFKTWADVEKEARAKPDTIKILTSGYGIADDIHANYLISKGLKVVPVPFAKPSERYASLLGGHGHVLYEQLGDMRSFLEGKQMRPVLTITEKRLPDYPDVPTAKELGYDITAPQIRWAYMKPGTDPKRVKMIADALAKMGSAPEYQDYLKKESAAPDSFVNQPEARNYILKMLQGLNKEASAAGMKQSH